MSIGFLGLGLMGRPMAHQLCDNGFDVLAWNRSATAPQEPVRVAGSVAEVGAECDTVISMLPDLPPLQALLPELLQANTVRRLVVMSTCSPVAVQELAADHPDLVVIDAPVSGGVALAQRGELSIMVGAEPDTYAAVLPLLQAMGSTITRMGPVGAGSVAKACNQLVVAATVAALAEAVNLAQHAGLDSGELLRVLGAGLASSRVLEQKRDAFIDDDFTASGPARYMVKDLRFAAEAARATQAQVPMAGLLSTIFDGVVETGLGDQDNSVVLRWLREQ